MIKNSYTKNYLKIYLWQGFSLILNFISIFIVVPYISSNSSVYGVYAICASISIFFSYADLGFLEAGQKYAAECFAINDRGGEIKILGFTSFILLSFLFIISLIIYYFSLNTEFLIKDLHDNKYIAQSLLLILAIFAPFTFIQRISNVIFHIRMESFILQRINIFASVIKISSVFLFFSYGKYDIVGYFLLTQLVNLIFSIIALLIAKYRYNYNLIFLLKSIKYNKFIFNKMKNLAYSTLFISLTWILYYELDSIIIGKYLGATNVAIYAIGFTILTFFRNIFGIVYSPFTARFNHFIGLKDYNGLKAFYSFILKTMFPIVILPIFAIFLYIPSIILTWVGISYTESIFIAKILVLCNLFAFISYPTGIILISIEKIKLMYIVNSLLPFIYWLGIIFTFNYFELLSFPIFKFITFFISGVVYLFFAVKYLEVGFWAYIKDIFSSVIFSLIFILITFYAIYQFLPTEKSSINLIIVLSTVSFIIFLAMIICFLTSKSLKENIIMLKNKI